jgi:hypothetical protein
MLVHYLTGKDLRAATPAEIEAARESCERDAQGRRLIDVELTDEEVQS